MSNKDKYIHFSNEHPDIPIFSQPWWLDAVCPDKWDVVLIERNEIVIVFSLFLNNDKKLSK